MANPVEAIEKLTREKISLPEDTRLIVRDQTIEEVIYINIPVENALENIELNEEQFEKVTRGCIWNPHDDKPWTPLGGIHK